MTASRGKDTATMNEHLHGTYEHRATLASGVSVAGFMGTFTITGPRYAEEAREGLVMHLHRTGSISYIVPRAVEQAIARGEYVRVEDRPYHDAPETLPTGDENAS